MLRLLIGLAAALLLAAAPGQAAAGLRSVALVENQLLTGSSLLVGPGGSALAAYSSDKGVFVTGRRPSGRWSPAQRVAADAQPSNAVLPQGPGRARAVVWQASRGGRPVLRLAPRRADGKGFGRPETFATPGFVLAARSLRDGTVTMVLQDDVRILAVERSPRGRFSRRTLVNSARFVGLVESRGRLVAAWAGDGRGDRGQIYAADRRPGGGWTGATALGDPRRNNADTSAGAHLLADAGGNLTAVWNSRAADAADPPAPDGRNSRIDAARRRAGGGWQPPQAISKGFRPSAAVSPSGRIGVRWFGEARRSPFAAARPGRPFATGVNPADPPGAVTGFPLAIDNSGRAVAVTQEFDDDGGTRLLVSAGALGCMVPVARLGRPRRLANAADLAVRGDGTGVLTWTESPGVAPPDALYAAAVTRPKRRCPKAIAPPPGPPKADATLDPLPASISRRQLLEEGLAATLRLGRQSTFQASLGGRTEAGDPVGLGSRFLVDVPAGQADFVVDVDGDALARVTPKLRFSVLLTQQDGAQSVFNRTIRLAD